MSIKREAEELPVKQEPLHSKRPMMKRVKTMQPLQQNDDLLCKSTQTCLVDDEEMVVAEASYQSKQEYLTEKLDCCSLGKEKIVYQGVEASPSFIVRDLHSTTAYKAFGVREKDSIRRVFMAIMKLLAEKDKKVIRLAKFKGAVEKIVCVANEWSEAGHLDDYVIENVKSTKHKTKTIHVKIDDSRSIDVTLVILNTYAQFRLSNHVENQMTNGVYLFVSEIINLLKFVSNHFLKDGLHVLSVDRSPYTFIDTERDDFF